MGAVSYYKVDGCSQIYNRPQEIFYKSTSLLLSIRSLLFSPILCFRTIITFRYYVELKLFYFVLWSVCRERGRETSLMFYLSTTRPDKYPFSFIQHFAFIACIRKLLICPNCSFSRSDWAFDMGGFLRAFAAMCMPVVCIVVHHQLFDPRTYRRVRLTLSASASGGWFLLTLHVLRSGPCSSCGNHIDFSYH